MISAEEAAHRAASDREHVIWVDEYNRPQGVITRQQLRERGLIGRCSFIFLFDSLGRLCIHQRALSKAVYPGFWDVAAGGMVGADESYAVNAARELQEELGVQAALTDHGCFLFDQPGNRLWGAVYSCVSDQPLRVQREEIQHACFVSRGQWRALKQRLALCPDSLTALQLSFSHWLE